MSTDALSTAYLGNALNEFISSQTSGAQVRLFCNNIIPTPGTLSSQFQECVGSWYSSKSITYGNAILNPDNSWSVYGTSLQWNYGNSTQASQTVYGYIVTTPASGSASPDWVVIHSKVLPVPVVMGANGDGVIVEPELTFPSVVAV